MLKLQYQEKVVQKSTIERWSQMTTKNTLCKEHEPLVSAISTCGDEQFSLCVNCDTNIERYYYDSDPEQFPTWTDWYVNDNE